MSDTVENIPEANVVDLDAKRKAKNDKRREQRAAKKAAKEQTDQQEKDSGFKKIGHTFRPKTKRRACFDLLNRSQGATLEEGVKATQWASNVVLSEYYEIAKACGASVLRDGTKYHLKGGRR